MTKEKAYKLLAIQEKISNSKAKSLIDRGVVFAGNRKVKIARGEIDVKTLFRVEKLQELEVILEDEQLIAVNKPAFLTSDEVVQRFDGATLLHRLDKETSGILVLTKDEAFRGKAIRAFMDDKVYKEYVALVTGVVAEEVTVDAPIMTQKKGGRAYSKISPKGKPAVSEITPIEFMNKKSRLKVVIHHGRTHQIRVHLKSIGNPVVGDTLYGGRESKRIMLHAKKMELLGYSFEALEPKIFNKFMNS